MHFFRYCPVERSPTGAISPARALRARGPRSSDRARRCCIVMQPQAHSHRPIMPRSARPEACVFRDGRGPLQASGRAYAAASAAQASQHEAMLTGHVVSVCERLGPDQRPAGIGVRLRLWLSKALASLTARASPLRRRRGGVFTGRGQNSRNCPVRRRKRVASRPGLPGWTWQPGDRPRSRRGQ